MACKHKQAAAFSLLEVLVAIMILGVGLIMVAAVFPVAGDWTRQSTEQSVAQSVARNALAIIKARYSGSGQDLLSDAPLTTGAVNLLPGLSSIPLNERAYQFGSDTPFPAQNPAASTYFWTALARLSPNQSSGGRSVDIYILVSHKGAVDQLFTNPNPQTSTGDPPFVPIAVSQPYDPSARTPRPGEYAIARQSGTVFRQTISSTGAMSPRPALSSADTEIWIAPPADGTAASPLVYIFQTTISF